MKMPLEEQLKHIKQEYPEGYDYLSKEIKLPRFDDDDEVISEKEEEEK